MTKQFTVQGTAATHSVDVLELVTFPTHDAMMADYTANKKHGYTVWTPENGANFETVGSACGWLKKLLKKNGWPTPTKWTIESTQVPGFNVGIQVVLHS